MPYKNPEDKKRRDREYRLANLKRLRETHRLWEIRNKDHIREEKRKWFAVHPEFRKASYQRNRASALARGREYYKKNHEHARAVAKARYHANPRPTLARNFLAKYGITLDDYEQRVRAQNGLCLICGAAAKLVVDHCHRKGHIRGLLCGSCNKGLGFFRDDTQILTKAITYLTNDSRIARQAAR